MNIKSCRKFFIAIIMLCLGSLNIDAAVIRFTVYCPDGSAKEGFIIVPDDDVNDYTVYSPELIKEGRRLCGCSECNITIKNMKVQETETSFDPHP